MREIWQRLEAWYQKNAGVSLSLCGGASAAEIAKAEKAMGVTFPADLRASFAAHNGQGDDSHPWLPGWGRLASLKEIVSQWKDERDREEDDADGEDNDGKRLSCMVHPKRVPLSGAPYWDGDLAWIDLAPGSKGTIGQVIGLVSECDFEVMAPSLEAFVSRWVELLESGALVWSAKNNEVVPAGEKVWETHPGEWFVSQQKKPKEAAKPTAKPTAAKPKATPKKTATPKAKPKAATKPKKPASKKK